MLFDRLGQGRGAAGQIQEALGAYESGLQALAAEAGLDIEGVLVALGVFCDREGRGLLLS